MQATQVDTIEEVLAAARPRLLRQVQRRGIAPDATDDIVQETLVEAWQHLNMLRMPDRFDAWLDGICRNMCLRWCQHHQHSKQRLTSLADPLSDMPFQADEQTKRDIADPLAFDPVEELNRQDLCTLLDRALSYLSDDAQQLVELCYLTELPQREAALRLGLTVNVLEARLHRARKRLRQVLNTDLRMEALAFGLALDEEATDSWRPSREWCWYCGLYHLQGTFETLPTGLTNFKMRCPACTIVVNTGGLPKMEGLRSFRPALKRVWHAIHAHSVDVEKGISFCPMCGESRPVRVLHPDELAAAYPSSFNLETRRSALVIDCPTCDIHVQTAIDGCLLLLPVVQRFMEQYPRRFIEPERLIEHEGQTAICFSMIDFISAARLTLLVHHRTLRVLAMYQS